MDEAKEKFGTSHDSAKEAFEELCALVDAMMVRGSEYKSFFFQKYLLKNLQIWHLAQKIANLASLAYARSLAGGDMFATYVCHPTQI